MSTSPRGGKARKEAYFVQIENADKTPMFVNVSSQLGKPLAISKPLATTMMRIRDDAILFSVLKLYAAVRTRLTTEPLALQPGPLARLERCVPKVTEPLTNEQLLVEIGEDRYELELKRDDNGVATLDFAADVEDKMFTLPRKPLQITLYLNSPRTKRLMVVGWQGYQAKPDTPETVTRAAAQALNHLSGLAEFQVLSGITTVKVPAPPGRYQLVAPTRKAGDRVEFTVPVRLWTADEQPAPVGAGTVKVNVDLDNANPATSQLLFHATPSADIEAHFDGYRGVFERAISAAYVAFFGDDELTDLVCNIALGDVSDGDLGRLRDAAATILGLDLNPRMFVPYNPAG